jgi:transcriptional regulator with XRE-family HTH domain
VGSTSLTPNASPRHLLGAELRRWRHTRGLSVSQLAAMVYVSRELLQKVESAHRNASADLVAACDLALDTGGVLARLLEFAEYQEGEHARQANAAASDVPPASPPSVTAPVSILFTVTAELMTPTPYDREADETSARAVEAGGARIYRFPASRRSGDRR